MNLLEQIKEEILEAKTNPESNGRTFYSDNLKNKIIKYKDDNNLSSYAISKMFNLDYSIVQKWSNKNSSIKAKYVEHGSNLGKRYTIETKVNVAKKVLEEGASISSVSKSMNITALSISRWVKDYQDGLYSLENCVQITRKQIKSYDVYLDLIQKKEDEINSLKEEARKALELEYKTKLKTLGV